jgi:hypothetical protein
MVEMVKTVRVCDCSNLRSRHPRTTSAAMCLVWNDLLTN